MSIAGNARAILSAERTALNFIGHMSGIATATSAFVQRIAHTKARIICTRKTTPGLRAWKNTPCAAAAASIIASVSTTRC